MLTSLSALAARRRPILVLAAVVATGGLLASACTASSGAGGTGGGSSAASGSGSSSAPSSSSSSPATPSSTKPTGPPPKPVHVQGYPDGSTVGVGMPIIATFNKKITDGRGFAKGTSVTVNGKPVHGAWYFEYSAKKSGHVMEAHYRLQNYWPAHANVVMKLNLAHVSAGKGLVFDGKLTSLSFHTGPANISTVNDATHQMTVVSDGKQYGKFPVSLGSASTGGDTLNGIKVIMEKGADISMRGPGYYDPSVKWTQRLTYGGEYLHSAPWNTPANGGDIGSGDSSNGCTNLLPGDAERLYNFLRIGDVVRYPNANGKHMGLGDGYGDWNVDWGTWQTGGAVKTA